MKKILVTGGAGYIGSHTTVELINKGFHPIIIDDFRNSHKDVIDAIARITAVRPEYYSIDLCDRKQVFETLASLKINTIIHFAAYKAVGESVQEPLKYYHNNISSLVNILEWASKNDVTNIIFSSSCTIYGEPQGITEVTEESYAKNASSPYGQTKVIGEQILVDYKVSHPEARILSLRYFNPIGAHPSAAIGELPLGKPNNLLPYITQSAVGILPELTIFGNDYPTPDGTCIRDYIHVVDLAKAHVMGIDYIESKQLETVDFINIGTGKGTSVLEMVEQFEAVTQQKISWKFGPRRSGDVPEIYANCEKARTQLGWTPQYTYQDAILHAWQWELNYRKKNVD